MIVVVTLCVVWAMLLVPAFATVLASCCVARRAEVRLARLNPSLVC